MLPDKPEDSDSDSDDYEKDYYVLVGPNCLLPGKASQKGIKAELLVGVVALRPIGEDWSVASQCEIKRMFVDERGRKIGVGKALSSAVINAARRIGGYDEVLLDSLHRLEGAIRIYKSLGFCECEKYCECPEKDHVCMSLRLEEEATG